jgi:hypothetical protein
MNAIIKIMIVIVFTFPNVVNAEEIICVLRSEMGETTAGRHIYERDDALKVNNLSRFDFEELLVTSAEGIKSKIKKVDNNVYRTIGHDTPYHFITNEINSIITEVSVGEDATLIKVLLCK